MNTLHTLPKALTALVQDMCRVGGYAWERGWAEMNAGNMSIDVSRFVRDRARTARARTIAFMGAPEQCAGRAFLVTVAGSCFRNMGDDAAANIMFIRVLDTLDGYEVLWGGHEGAPATSELATHLTLQARMGGETSDGCAVFHTHPTHLIALTHIAAYCNATDLDRLLRSMHPEVTLAHPGGIGFVPYHEPGSVDLARATVDAMVKHGVVVWEKHGCVAVGSSIQQAFDRTDICNKAAEIFFLCKGTGHDVQGLREEDLRRLEGT